jgi:hypothetical protein
MNSRKTNKPTDGCRDEYEKFEVQRREFKESLGEADYTLDCK